ncbi:hypothetical protein D3C81_2049170 [compost metagenome]
MADLKRLAAGIGSLRFQIGIFIEAGDMVIDAAESLMPEYPVQFDRLFLRYLRHFVHQTVADAVFLAVIEAYQVFPFIQPSAQEITDPVQ